MNKNKNDDKKINNIYVFSDINNNKTKHYNLHDDS